VVAYEPALTSASLRGAESFVEMTLPESRNDPLDPIGTSSMRPALVVRPLSTWTLPNAPS